MPLFDIHVHTSRYSPCSLISPESLVGAALARGLDGLVITEHGRHWPRRDLEELERRGGGRVRIFGGQEIRTRRGGLFSGDLLVFGTDRPFQEDLTPEKVLEATHAHGGVVVAAHPFRSWLSLEKSALDLPLDGIEALNGNCGPGENRQAEMASSSRGLPALGGSDAHLEKEVGHFATDFQGVVESMADMVRLIKEGRCRPAVPGS